MVGLHPRLQSHPTLHIDGTIKNPDLGYTLQNVWHTVAYNTGLYDTTCNTIDRLHA